MILTKYRFFRTRSISTTTAKRKQMVLPDGSSTTGDWPWDPTYYRPEVNEDQEALLTEAIKEIQEISPLSTGVKGGRSWVWRYLEGTQWLQEPVRGKRVSSFFVDTLEWRERENVDNILERPSDFIDEAASGKLFVGGKCLQGRPLIWAHLGRENNVLDPEANVRYLIYTVERAIASMGPDSLTSESKGQFCVVADCTYAARGPLPSLAFARRAISMLTLHYPSRLGKLLIVNAGSAVYYLWQAVSLLLAPVTREKVVIISGSDKHREEELLKYVSREALEAGRIGAPGERAFDSEGYLNDRCSSEHSVEGAEAASELAKGPT